MSSQNVGEELVGAYLQTVKGCEFVSYNLHTRDTQGEIDVVAINMKARTVYLCEVAIHLVTGLQYVSGGQPDNVRRLVPKFSKDVDYAKKYFRGYKKVFMLWSLIVIDTRSGSKHNQRKDVDDIKKQLRKSKGIDLQAIINEDFRDCLEELKEVALEETRELKSPVMRLLQIQAKLNDRLTTA